MELGYNGLRWIPLVPDWNENRSLEQDEQLSLEIQRLNTGEIYTIDDTSRTMRDWITKKLDEYPSDKLRPEMDKALEFPTQILAMGNQFCENVRNLKNFIFDGKQETDPFKVFIQATPADSSSQSIIGYVNSQITLISTQFGDDLKNSVRRLGGAQKETTPTEKPTTPDA